jgi:predicted transcriptional regulator
MTQRTTKTNTATTRVSGALSKKLDYYAKIADRTRSWVIEDILKRYIDDEIAFVEAVNIGIESANRGDLLPHDEAMKEVREFIAKKKQEMRRNQKKAA